MTKDEIKNGISMALKDPILQQGFEIICKENAELKSDNDARKFAMAMSEKVEKQLREENTELKKLKRECETSICRAEYQYNYEQLTKAKEIIRKLVLEVKGYEEINGYDTCEPVQEAEQFLNSEVEK